MTDPADIPPPLPWEARKKSATSVKGGYTGYLNTVRKICQFVDQERPKHPVLVRWLQDNLNYEEKNSEAILRNLLTRKVLESTHDQITLNQYASRWYTSEDDGILIALLHSRIQFFGEMLAELRGAPLAIGELLEVAEKYGLHWRTPTQIWQRRGWLESAKLIEPIGNDRLAITDAGRDLLSKLTIHSPDSMPEHTHAKPRPDPAPDSIPTTAPEATPSITDNEPEDSMQERESAPAEALANEIRDAATDSKKPDRLEFAVRDAFRFLGFEAEKLGGSGKTDVLVTAPLGKDDSYTVTIDAKTVGSGSLGDHQVDWATMVEHQEQHNADYSMVVGPNPSGQRIMDRAADRGVAVLSTDQLADLCIQHADTPLSLQDYRPLFETGGAVDTTPINKAAQDSVRLREVAADLMSTLADQTSDTGPLTARDLWLLLRNSPSSQTSSEQEIQQLLNVLSSPLVGAVQGTADGGYVVATAPRVTQQRLHQLGDHLATLESSQDQ